MIVNRMIDNASVAIAAIDRRPVTVSARAQAAGASAGRRRDRVRRWPQVRVHAGMGGLGERHGGARTRLSTTRSWPPNTAIPATIFRPILAVAQHAGRAARELVRGIATGYEIQVDLVRAICLHKHKIDHVAHLGPSAAAGIGTLLGLAAET